jgi:hypothetical protein
MVLIEESIYQRMKSLKGNEDENLKRKEKKVNQTNLSTLLPQKNDTVLDTLRSLLRCRATRQ